MINMVDPAIARLCPGIAFRERFGPGGTYNDPFKKDPYDPIRGYDPIDTPPKPFHTRWYEIGQLPESAKPAKTYCGSYDNIGQQKTTTDRLFDSKKTSNLNLGEFDWPFKK